MWKLPEAGRKGGQAGGGTKPYPRLGEDKEDNVNSGFVDSAAKQASAHVE